MGEYQPTSGRELKRCDHDSHELYERLINPLRARAQELGYALAVHGTLVRDIDLIAVPWTDAATDARTLAMALQDVVRSIVPGEGDMSWYPGRGAEFSLNGGPGMKPHGRLGWVFNLGGGPYIDLSVMPRVVVDLPSAVPSPAVIDGETA